MIPDYNSFYMNVAYNIAQRSPCNRKKVGAIIVTYSGEIISSGFNSPFDISHPCECHETGETLDNVIHAEAKAIAQLSLCGMSDLPTNCSMYVTLSPCIYCANLILASTIIDKVFYRASFSDKRGIELLEKYGVKCIKLNN